MDVVDTAVPSLETDGGTINTDGADLSLLARLPEPELPADRFLDRELSWLAFNDRVLDLARDTVRVPLLERLKFLAIFTSNLDEFFMVRVAGLKRRIAAGVPARHRLARRVDAATVLVADPSTGPASSSTTQHRLFSTTRSVPPSPRPTSRSCDGTSCGRESASACDVPTSTTEVSPVLTPLGVDPRTPSRSSRTSRSTSSSSRKNPDARGDVPGSASSRCRRWCRA